MQSRTSRPAFPTPCILRSRDASTTRPAAVDAPHPPGLPIPARRGDSLPGQPTGRSVDRLWRLAWLQGRHVRIRMRRGVRAGSGFAARTDTYVTTLASSPDPPATARTKPAGFARRRHRFLNLDRCYVTSGSDRCRFPVNANKAFATAGAMGGVPGSPTPPGACVDGTRCTSTAGISFIRITG